MILIYWLSDWQRSERFCPTLTGEQQIKRFRNPAPDEKDKLRSQDSEIPLNEFRKCEHSIEVRLYPCTKCETELIRQTDCPPVKKINHFSEEDPQISEEDIQKFGEVCGWTRDLILGYWHPPSCGNSPSHMNTHCNYPAHRNNLPDFTNNPANCLECLNYFCDTGTGHKLGWTLCRMDQIFSLHIVGISTDYSPGTSGTTICESVVRAVLAAAKILLQTKSIK